AAFYQLAHFSDAERRYELAESTGDELRAARAAYDRGNCALRQACQAEDTSDLSLLDRAAEKYRACLEHQENLPDAGSLFADARHNLELTKLLRNPTTIDGEAVAQNDSNKADSEQAAGNDQPGNEAGSVQASVKRRPDAAPEAANSSEMLASLVGLRAGDDDLCPD